MDFIRCANFSEILVVFLWKMPVQLVFFMHFESSEGVASKSFNKILYNRLILQIQKLTIFQLRRAWNGQAALLKDELWKIIGPLLLPEKSIPAMWKPCEGCRHVCRFAFAG
jgi:hypothetical protein